MYPFTKIKSMCHSSHVATSRLYLLITGGQLAASTAFDCVHSRKYARRRQDAEALAAATAPEERLPTEA